MQLCDTPLTLFVSFCSMEFCYWYNCII